jgi:dihydropteroate synthase
MGVINVTPDSFSDGGIHFQPKQAIDGGLRMLDDGADILDIGGESTRPGTTVAADANAGGSTALVSAEEELRRVLPVIQGILRASPGAVISVDTYKAAVARAAVEGGAEIVNDVSGLQWDTETAAVCAEVQCGLVVMHTRGTPKQWRTLPRVAGIASTVEHDLANRLQVALERGIARHRIVVDPGFGFGKDYEENYALLAHLEQLQHLGFPILAGSSRKGFIGKAVGNRRAELPRESSSVAAPVTAASSSPSHEEAVSSAARSSPRNHEYRLQEERQTNLPVNERLYGSLAAMVTSILRGAHIVRVHDVKPSVEAAAVADEVLRATSG